MMRTRSAVLSLAAVLVIGVGVNNGALSAAAELPAWVLAPAHDATTVGSLHNLAIALNSYGLDAGGFDGLTVAALADWGWTPSGRTAVTIWVAGGNVRVIGQDTGPGSTQYEYTTVGGTASSGEFVRSATQPAESPRDATVMIVAATHL